MLETISRRQKLVISGLLGAMLLAPALAAQPAAAQATTPVVTNAIPQGVEVTFQAKIKKINQSTRELTLEAPNGETAKVVAGPGVRLNLYKAGDIVTAQYYRSVAFIISTPGEPVPPDQMAAMLARPVQTPGGIAVKEVQISGTVVGIDLSSNTVQVIPPGGGQVVTLEVTDPVRQAHLKDLKVGDTVTAIVSQALVISVEPKK
jgi:hypothetical protein